MTAEAHVALAQCRRAAREHRQAVARLHAAIRSAAPATSQRSIGDAVGLSVSRVNQIVHGRSK